MNTELFTLSRVFTESIYRIPDYQRGYSWKEEHLKDFWLDIEQLESDRRHYTGVLTLETVPEEKWSEWVDDRWIIKSRRYKPYYVVDGQQRLTTAVILLQCILEKAPAHQLNFTRIDDIRRKYIFDAKPEELARSYIFGYERDNPSYEFLKRKIFCDTSNTHAPDEETIYTKNLAAAKEFFLKELEKLDERSIETVFTKVTQQLVFNVYEIADDIDVFVSFETMNNRGKPLSTLELLKNRLIFLSTRLPAAEGEDATTLRRTINEAWKTVYHYLGKNDRRPLGDDDFLITHLTYFYPTKLRKLKLESGDEVENAKAIRRYHLSVDDFNRFLLNEVFSPKRLVAKHEVGDLPMLSRRFIYDYAQELKESVDLFYKVSTPSDSKFTSAEKISLERLGRLLGYSPPPLVLALYLLERDGKKRAMVLEKFERFMFCSSLVFRSPGPRRAIRGGYVLEYISGKLSTEDLCTQLDNYVTEMFRETSVVEALGEWVKNGPSYYGWRSIKYFLFEYELELQSNSKSSRQKIDWDLFASENYKDDYQTIEHIYPQRARHPYWTERFSKFSSPQKRLLRNSLGNLLALAQPRNSSLGNKSFPEKLGDEHSQTGYRFGSYSENEVAQASEWTTDAIVERGIKLLTFLERRWRVSTGDRENKIKALGLDFLRRGRMREAATD